METFVVVAWAVWNNPNNALWKQKRFQSQEIVHNTLSWLSEIVHNALSWLSEFRAAMVVMWEIKSPEEPFGVDVPRGGFVQVKCRHCYF